MKEKFKYLFASLILILSFNSCKDEDKVVYVQEILIEQAEIDGSITVAEDDVIILNMTVYPEDATKKSVKFISDDQNVFTVSAQGIIYGAKEGVARLTIRSSDGSGVTAEYIVNVVKEDIKITSMLAPERLELNIGTFSDLSSRVTLTPYNATNKTLIYTSSNTSVVTITEEGYMKGVDLGLSTIFVETTDGSNITKEVEVEVKQIAVTGLTLATTSKTIKRGDSFDLNASAIVLPSNAGDKSITFVSSDASVASVTEAGIVKGIAKGEAVITVRTNDGGFEQQCVVKVKDELLDRSLWTITSSHGFFLEANICFQGYALFDNDNKTNIGIVKAGKTAGGISVPENDKIYLLIDTKEMSEFDYFIYRHRDYNTTSQTIRARQISLYGSNEGTQESDFTLIKGEATISTTQTAVTVTLDKPETYQYIKIEFEDWDKASGNTIQLSEFNLGLTEK